MAETIKGLRIDLSLKDMGIGRSITELKRSFRTLNSDLKVSSKNFEYTEKSTQSYKRRLEELDGAVKVATKNVSDLENEYHTVAEAQGHNSKQAQALRAEYNRQATELKFLKDNLNDTTQEYKEFTKAQQIANSGWTKAGNGMTNISRGLDSVSSKLVSTGQSLTNNITKPAMVATGAVTALVGKLGFDRLVGIDSARAKLDGLGYSGKEVTKIQEQVTKAIEGSMTTMEEGTNAAAAGLSAGVEEGKELEKWVTLIGDASVASGRPVADMTQIFARIKGTGKLMTEELNMIEDGMPGFTKVLAENMGVSMEEVRKMATEGKISFEDFEKSIAQHSGGMAEAYSKSFAGMVKNTKAYVGIIGENLLKGVFEKSKDSLRELEKLLKSDGVQQWAKDTGDKLANGVEKMSNAISGIVSWFNSLDKGTQKSIASIMKWSTLILIGIGPVLTIFGKLTGVLAGTFGGLGKFLGFMGKLSVESKNAGSLLGGFTKLFPKLGGAIGLVANPIGLTVLAIGALVAGLVIAYKKSETFRNIVNGAFNAIVTGLSALWNGIKTFLQPVIKAITDFGGELKKTIGDFWAENGAQFMQALTNIKNGFMSLWTTSKPAISAIGTAFSAVFNAIKAVVIAVMPVITTILKVGWTLIQALIVSVWNNIKGVITGALNIIMGVIKVFSGIFTGDFKLMWEGVKQIFAGAFQFLWNLVQLWFVGKIFGIFKLGFGLIKGIVTRSLGGVRGTFSSVLTGIWGIVKKIFTGIWTFIKFIFGNVLKFTKAIWTMIKLAVTNPVKLILILVRATFTTLSKVVRAIFTGLSKVVKAIWTGLKNAVIFIVKLWFKGIQLYFNLIKKVALTIFNFVKSAVTKIWRLLKNAVITIVKLWFKGVQAYFNLIKKIALTIFNALSKAVKAIWNALKNAIIKTVRFLYNTVRKIFTTLKNTVVSIVQKLKNTAVKIFDTIKTNVVNIVTKAKDGVVNGFKAMFDKGKSWINKLKNFLGDSVSGFKKVAGKVGKSVANGAISGLNKMIDGINSLSNKIMNKKLIKKKIPKLSTGTGLSPQVKTDSNGLLKRGTKAIVNDKGLGNARGANGHKELIYRKGGKIERPIGNNKKVSLKRGDGVINGAQAKPLLPHFSTGTVMSKLFGQGSGAKGNKNKKKEKKGFWQATGENLEKGWDATKDVGKDVAKTTGKGIKSVMKGIGDVWDYASNPGKLINKVMGGLGINFDGIGGVMGNFIKWGAKKLKSGMVDLVTGWFEEESGGAGGDGSSFTKYPKTTPYSPNKAVPGYPTAFNGGKHFGIDYSTPSGVTLTAPTAGKVSKISDYGGGTIAKLLSGNFTQFFMHLSEVLKTGRVKQGEAFAKTGNSGHWTTGAHLHYQVEKGNSPYVTNKNTIDPEKFLAGSGGGSKSASKWRSDIIRAGKEMKANLTGKEINGIIAQIARESNGNASVTQGNIGDINNRNGTPAQGLLQYVPSTFKAYAVKGKQNINNGYHQLLAFFNNKNWRRDLPYGKSGWSPTGGRRFATGGVIRENGLYNLTEQGHEEIVIPTDPRRSSDAMKLMAYASEKIQGKGKKNKRPNQLSNGNTQVTPNDNTEILALMAQQLQAQKEQIDLLTQIALSNAGIEAKAGFSVNDVNRAQGKKQRRNNFIMGGS
ncbi:tape measure protein [Mammaliicoccus sciuri]|uniref:tape measure protein n=1 Tax=Mammaliicoccus sciuri TaxID=1296 RepID=UPI002DBC7BF8|nr:tape measure protein [Mammaliicoccus sciuri]MEB5650166.1 tape measure protein [Mammaliicoccus sciuri]